MKDVLANADLSTLGIGSAIGLALAILGFLSKEMEPLARWCALKLYRSAVRRLPERLHEVKKEEWLAELEAMKGSRISVVLLAASMRRAAGKIASVETSNSGKLATVKIRAIPVLSFEVDDLLIRVYASQQLLGRGTIQVNYSAMMRRGYARTYCIELPEEVTDADIAMAIYLRHSDKSVPMTNFSYVAQYARRR